MHFSNVLITVVSMATKLQPEFAVPYCRRYESRSILGWAMHFIFVHLHAQNILMVSLVFSFKPKMDVKMFELF